MDWKFISRDTSWTAHLCCFRFPAFRSIHSPVFTPIHKHRNCYYLIKFNMCILSLILLLFNRLNSWTALDDFTKHKMQSFHFMVVTGLRSIRSNVANYNIQCPKQRALVVCRLWLLRSDTPCSRASSHHTLITHNSSAEIRACQMPRYFPRRVMFGCWCMLVWFVLFVTKRVSHYTKCSRLNIHYELCICVPITFICVIFEVSVMGCGEFNLRTESYVCVQPSSWAWCTLTEGKECINCML
jgi:hypothetical protein